MSAHGDSLILGLQMLAEDPQAGRIPLPDRADRVRAALDDGRNHAVAASGRWGKDPDFIARACGVPVTDSDAMSGFGTTLVFAEYSTRQPGITLYSSAIAQLDRRLAELPGHVIGHARALFLAHELYHHLDCTDPRGPIARRHPVTIFRLSRWRWTSGVRALAEIAAGAFAQQLLGLSFHPKTLDLLLLQSQE